MQLTQNFSLEEFACKDGTPVPASLYPNIKKLAQNLQVLRDHVGKPVVLNSGYRTPSYNKKIGGAKDSQHPKANAGDIKIAGMTPKQVHSTILQLIKEGKMHNGGLGLYSTFVHYDVRPVPARWNG
ncbi:hypothetical protein ASG31_08395 [Chryseobacterium sp. Leaf404]|uniref:YcbK family protein n=1 Tax=unclassified Chryseobacterium TaxID=2593645 RepID=UPI0006F4A0BA|nr:MULTISPECIES: D-Ala-D-Ala carboxypeptidase family metallohydrolase [unclassified Chryseobacterium]KQT17420.1 hypothetical protein ASG31_08395 [Chryseobacterium sp. Leaf404]